MDEAQLSNTVINYNERSVERAAKGSMQDRLAFKKEKKMLGAGLGDATTSACIIERCLGALAALSTSLWRELHCSNHRRNKRSATGPGWPQHRRGGRTHWPLWTNKKKLIGGMATDLGAKQGSALD